MALYHRKILVIVALAVGFLPAQSPAQIKSNFSSSITSESMAAVWIAKDRGLFKKYGLDVQYILMPRSPLAVSALIAGEIDMAVIGPGHLVNAATGGTDVIGIANFAQKLDYRLNTRPEIKKKEDLRGKRIAISGPGSTSHLVSLLALQHLGLDPNAAKIAFLTISGTEINRRLALESGSIDATTLNGSIGDLYGSDDAANHARHHTPVGIDQTPGCGSVREDHRRSDRGDVRSSQQRNRHTHHRFELATIESE